MANTPQDWNALADRLESVAQEMIDQSGCAPDELDGHMIVLWARSLMHSAIEMRFFAAEGASAQEQPVK